MRPRATSGTVNVERMPTFVKSSAPRALTSPKVFAYAAPPWHLVGDLLDEQRLLRPDDISDFAHRTELTLRQHHREEGLLAPIDVRRCDEAQVVVVEHADEAPVPEPGDRQAAYLRERLVVVERAGEREARLGEEAQGVFDALALRDVPADGQRSDDLAVGIAERRNERLVVAAGPIRLVRDALPLERAVVRGERRVVPILEVQVLVKEDATEHGLAVEPELGQPLSYAEREPQIPVGRVDDRRKLLEQAPQVRLVLAEGLERRDVLGDVDHHTGDLERPGRPRRTETGAKPPRTLPSAASAR